MSETLMVNEARHCRHPGLRDVLTASDSDWRPVLYQGYVNQFGWQRKSRGTFSATVAYGVQVEAEAFTTHGASPP